MSDDIYGIADREDLEKYAAILIKRNMGHIKKVRLDRMKKGTSTPIPVDQYFTIELFEDNFGHTRFTFCKCDPNDPIYDSTKPVAKEKHFDAVKAFDAFNMQLSGAGNDSDDDEVDPSPKKSKNTVKVEYESEQEDEVVEKPKSRKRRSLNSDDE